MTLTREAVLDALVDYLRDQLAGVEAMARLAADEATSDETRSEGKYDTRSIEASYLARGQAERVASLRAALSWARSVPRAARAEHAPIGTGSILQVHSEGQGSSWLIIASIGGGGRFLVAGEAVRTITPQSPLGRALLGAVVDDVVEVDVRGGRREVEVLVRL